MLPDASAPPPMQLPLPLALPTARPQPPPPPPIEVATRPEQVWGSLSPEVQARIRQVWLTVLREVADDRRGC
jgi:hypothetical protein